MNKYIHLVTDNAESSYEHKTSSALGHAIRILWMSPLRGLDIASACRRIWPAIVLDQIEFLYDSRGIPVAFATWAFVNDTTAGFLGSADSFHLHMSEWNEGLNLWFIDLVAPNGQARNLISKIKDTKFPTRRQFSYARRRVDRKFRVVTVNHI